MFSVFGTSFVALGALVRKILSKTTHTHIHTQEALRFFAFAEPLAGRIKSAGLADQLRRAAASICLNIAEGCGEFSPRSCACLSEPSRLARKRCEWRTDRLHCIGCAEV